MLAKLGAKAVAVGAALVLVLLATPGSAESDEPQSVQQEYEELWNQWVAEERLMETSLLQEFPETLTREDDTLIVVADNGSVVVFEDHHCYCSDALYYHVIEYISSLESFLIWESGHEWTYYSLVHKPTGTSVSILAKPVVDSSGRQFFAIQDSDLWYGDSGFVVGHVGANGIFLDANLFAFGFHDADWIDEDRIAIASRYKFEFYMKQFDTMELEYIGNEFDDGDRTINLVRHDGVWHLVDTFTIPLTPAGAE